METTNLLESIHRASNLFRIGAEGEGSRALLDILKTITDFVQDHSVQTALADQQSLVLLNDIALAQARGDFLYVADLLEYELPKTSLCKHYLKTCP
jgi:hypothetical protein